MKFIPKVITIFSCNKYTEVGEKVMGFNSPTVITPSGKFLSQLFSLWYPHCRNILLNSLTFHLGDKAEDWWSSDAALLTVEREKTWGPEHINAKTPRQHIPPQRGKAFGALPLFAAAPRYKRNKQVFLLFRDFDFAVRTSPNSSSSFIWYLIPQVFQWDCSRKLIYILSAPSTVDEPFIKK